jgi:DNA-binding NarL/FixJ family response regulator
MATKITVLLADDHNLVRKGFRAILEDDPQIEVVAEASNGVEAVRLAIERKPAVVIMDLSMPGMDGIQATTEILRAAPDTAILIVSMFSEASRVRSAFEAGARGYVLKNATEIDLAEAVKDIAAGGQVVGPGLESAANSGGEREPITQRERQILKLIAEGHANKEIAARLNLSVNTVAVHRANLMQALGVHGTAELVMYAIRTGLVNLP